MYVIHYHSRLFCLDPLLLSSAAPSPKLLVESSLLSLLHRSNPFVLPFFSGSSSIGCSAIKGNVSVGVSCSGLRR